MATIGVTWGVFLIALREPGLEDRLEQRVRQEGGRPESGPRFNAAGKVRQIARSNNLTTLDAGIGGLFPDTMTSARFNAPGESVSVATLKGLVRLPRLRELAIMGQRLTSEHLELIGEMTRLEDLTLEGCDLNDADLDHLRALDRLEFLSLENNPVTDASLEKLSGFQELKSLFLSDTKITGVTLGKLAGMPRLHELTLDRNAIKDDALRHLSGLRNQLTFLTVGPDITDAGAEHIARLTKLERLDLTSAPVTNEGLDVIVKAGLTHE